MLRWASLVALAACNFEETHLGDATPSPDTSFSCNNDPFEPNNTRTTATAATLANGELVLDNVSICPEGDVDMFGVVVAAASIEVVAVWQDGPAVSVALLDGSGTTIAVGKSLTSTSQRACLEGAPAGSYIGMATGNARNNYVLAIRLVSSCGPP